MKTKTNATSSSTLTASRTAPSILRKLNHQSHSISSPTTPTSATSDYGISESLGNAALPPSPLSRDLEDNSPSEILGLDSHLLDRVTSPDLNNNPMTERTVEEKRLLIRKQLVILLHAIVCRRRDLTTTANGNDPHPCNVPFCGLMKGTLQHLNICRVGRRCRTAHCTSSRQILIHWKYCVKSDCPVCVSLRSLIPTSLLIIFENPLCRAEVMNREAVRQRQLTRVEFDGSNVATVPELMESEE